jgi:hypothetical protein
VVLFEVKKGGEHVREMARGPQGRRADREGDIGEPKVLLVGRNEAG